MTILGCGAEMKALMAVSDEDVQTIEDVLKERLDMGIARPEAQRQAVAEAIAMLGTERAMVMGAISIKVEALPKAANSTTATHQDPGAAPEVATAPVIAESLQKAAKKEDRPLAEMKAELLGMIDAAIKETPNYKDYLDAVTKFGKDSAEQMYARKDRPMGSDTVEGKGSITFDVPGDGKFRVTNSFTGLSVFRAKIAKASGNGFSETKRPGLPASTSVKKGSTNQISAIESMLEDGDLQAAKDYMAAVGIGTDGLKKSALDRMEQLEALGDKAQEALYTRIDPAWEYSVDRGSRRATLTRTIGKDVYRAWVNSGVKENGEPNDFGTATYSVTVKGGKAHDNSAPSFHDALVFAQNLITLEERNYSKNDGTESQNTTASKAKDTEKVSGAPAELDLMGFTKTPTGNGTFTLSDSNMRVTVEPTGTGFQARMGSAKSGPRLTEQESIEWASALRDESIRIQKAEAKAKPEVSKTGKLPVFPVDAYRLERFYANGAKIKPLPARTFSLQEVQSITDWFKSIGWSVTSGSGGNGINATNDIGMTIDDLPEPYTAAQRKKDEALLASDERAAAKKKEQEGYLASTAAGKFVAGMFGDAMNRSNQVALAKVLSGDEKTFAGLFSNSAVDVLSEAGISAEGREIKDVIRDIKAMFDTAPTSSAKEPWQMTEAEFGEVERLKALANIKYDLERAKNGSLKPFVSGDKSKPALVRRLTAEVAQIEAAKPEGYAGDHLAQINKALREGKPVPEVNLKRYDIAAPKVEQSIANQTFDQWVRQNYEDNEYKATYLKKSDGDEKIAMLRAVTGWTDADAKPAEMLKEAWRKYFSELTDQPREASISLEVFDALPPAMQTEAQRHFYDLDSRLTRRTQDETSARVKAENAAKKPYEDALAEVSAEIARLDKISGPETQKQKDLSGRRARLEEAIWQIGQGKEPDGRLLKKDAPTQARRTNPAQTIEFKNPIVGPSGEKLVSYTWQWKPFEYVDKTGEERTGKLSDWDKSAGNVDTGREVVHQFTVESKDGETRIVSAESAIAALGYADKVSEGSAKSAISAAKTLARNKMQLAELESALSAFMADQAEVNKLALPEVTRGIGGWWAMGDSTVRQTSQLFPNSQPGELLPERMKVLEDGWRSNRLSERGWNLATENTLKEGIYDTNAQIKRAQAKLDSINVKTGRSAAETGLGVANGPVYAQRRGQDAPAAETQAVQSGIEGKSLIQAAQFVASTGSPAQREIAKRVVQKLLALQSAGVTLDLKIAHRGDMVPAGLINSRGYTETGFDDKGRDIVVWLNGADVTSKVGTDYETLLHELVHAATTGAILHGASVKNSVHAKSVADLKAVSSAIERHINDRFRQADAGSVELTEFEKDMRASANNAFRNMDEVVAWALSSSEAQQYLESIPYQGGSMWTRFVQAVREFLGLSAASDTALSEVLRVAEAIMNPQDANFHATQAFWHKRGIKMAQQQASGSKVLQNVRNERAEPFYSELSRQIEAANINAAPVIGWKAMLKGLQSKGVKADEITWSGIEEWLDLQTGKVAKADVLAYLAANGVQVEETVLGQPDEADIEALLNDEVGEGMTREEAIEYLGNDEGATPTKYDKYQLPGGQNYREVLLTLPSDVAPQDRGTAYAKDHTNDYQSSHWSQPNVLAHIRVNDRADADGRRVLFVEEIQSDWGQAGKKQGFRMASGGLSPTEEARFQQLLEDGRRNLKGAELIEFESLIARRNAEAENRLAPPAAPFVDKTDKWLTLSLKRIVKMAVDGGYDRVAFVNGQQSAERFSLDKHLSELRYEPAGEGLYEISGIDHNLVEVISEDNITIDRVEELVGKEMAEKIANGEGEKGTEGGYRDWRSFSGDGLKIEAKGMRAFYDAIVPNATKALLKKLGGGQMEIVQVGSPEWGVFSPAGDPLETGFKTKEAAVSAAEGYFDVDIKNEGGGPQPGFTITPAMQEKASNGLPLFRRQLAKFSRGAQKQANNAVQSTVDKLTADWQNKPEIVIAFDMQDEAIPDNVRLEDAKQRSGGAFGNPEGFYYRGVVYLLSSQLATDADIARVLAHESLGHYGLRGLYGKALKPILQQIATMRRADVIAVARQRGLVKVDGNNRPIVDVKTATNAQVWAAMTDSHKSQSAEEVLAEMAQTTPQAGFVKRAVAAIRQWLREHGVNLKLTDNDIIVNYILPARGWVERGPGGGGPKGGVSFARGAKSGDAENTRYTRQWYDRLVSLLPDSYRNDPYRREPLPAESGNAQQAREVQSKIDALNKQIRGPRDTKGYGPVTRDELGNLRVDAREATYSEIIGEIRDLADEIGYGVSVTGVQRRLIEKFKQAGFESEISLAAIADRITGARAEISDEKSVYAVQALGTIMSYKPRGFPMALFSRADQTMTTAFRAWFGGSKVVDDQGKPLVVYHGTNKDIKQFDAKRPMWFAVDHTLANRFVGGGRQSTGKRPGKGSMIYPVFLSIENPLDLTDYGLGDTISMLDILDIAGAPSNDAALAEIARNNLESGYAGVSESMGDPVAFLAGQYRSGQRLSNMLDNPGLIAALKKAGVDGLHLTEEYESGPKGGEYETMSETYAVFDSTQIKSATGNGGQFDPANADIRFSRATTARDLTQKATEAVRVFTNTPGKVNWWHKTVGTQYNLAQRSPEFKRVYDAVQDFIGDVSFYATEAADLAPKILPKLDTWRDIAKSPLSAEDTKAIAAPIFEGTLVWTRDEAGQPVKIKQMEDEAALMSSDKKSQRLLRNDKISEGVLKMWRGLPMEQYEALIDGKYEKEMLKAGVVWSKDELRSRFSLTDGQIDLYREFRASTDKSLTNLSISDMLYFGGKDVAPIKEAVLEAKTVNEAAEMLRDYLLSLADMDPANAESLIATANKMIDKGDRAADLMARGYAPLSRFGTYTLDVVDASGERVYFGLFESRFEADRMAKQMAAEYPGSTVDQGTLSEESYKLFAGVSPETVALFGDMLGLEDNGAYQDYLKLAKSTRSAMKRLIERKGIAGFSEDAGRVLAGFVYSNARQTSQNLHTGEMVQAANDIPKGMGELKDKATQLVEYIKHPQEEAQKIRGLLFAQYIGGSVASAMVNMTQPITMTMPWLSQFGGLSKAGKQMAAAVKDAGKKTTGDAALDAALKRGEEDGTVSPQEVHDLMRQSQGKGALKSGDGTKLGNAAANAQNVVSRIGFAWGKLFSSAEQFNRRVTFIAAYRTAVEQGMKDPSGFARKAIHETQGVYNKGNKPAWARGAVGSTLFTFKQYSIAYVEMLHRMATTGEPGSPERAAGRRGALYALAVLVLLSGVGGLPGADDLDDIISGLMQSLGYNFDSKAKRKAFLAEYLGDGAAQFMERGVSGLAGVPIDISGRMGLGNLIPATGLLTKKADHTSDVAELLGPAGDMAKRAFQAGGKLIDGDVLGNHGAIATAAPKAVQNLFQAADMADKGMYRDQTGKKVMETDAGDALSKALGFQPNDVKRAQDANWQVQQMKDLNRIKESEIASRWAIGLFEKNPEKIQSARDDLATWNADNPDAKIRINFAQIRKRVQDMNMTKAERIAKTTPAELRARVRNELALQ